MTSLNFLIVYIVAFSVIIQFAAALMAIRLIRITGRRTAWTLIATALVLMALRRVVALYHLMEADTAFPPDPMNESLGLALSIAMVIGISRIAPLFHEHTRKEESLHRLNRELRAISNCNQLLMRAKDEQTLLTGICHIVCEQAGYRMAWVGYVEHNAAKTVRPVAWGGAETGYLANTNITWADTESGHGPTGTAARSGKTTCIQDLTLDPQATSGRENAIKRGYRSNIALALRDDNTNIFGVLTIYSAAPNAFTLEEVRLLEELAADLAFGITVLRSRIELKKTEAMRTQLAAIVEFSSDAIIGKNPDGIITHWNKSAEQIYGYTADEIIGKPITVLAPPALHAEIHKFLGKIRQGETVVSHESERIRKDGTVIHVALSLSPIKDSAGNIIGISTIARDITEKKRVEEKLREASAYHRSLIEASLDPLVTISPEGKITDVNRTTEEVTGRNRSELIGTDFSDYFTEPEKAREGYQQVFKKGSVTDYPLAIRHQDGHITDVLYNASLYRDKAGEVLGVFAAARDITERKKAEFVLRQSEEGLEEAQRIAHLGSWHMDLATHEVVWSKVLYEMYGSDPAQPPPLYTESMKLFTPESWERLSSAIAQTTETGIPYELELQTVQKDGGRGWMLARGELVRDARGVAVRVRGVVMDITARKLAEDALKEKEERLALATVNNGVGIWDWNLKTQEMIWDDSMYALYHIRREDFSGTEEAWRASLHPDDLTRGDKEVEAAIAGVKPFNTEFRVVWPNGEVRYIKAVAKVFRDDQGVPLRMLGINMDITERKQAEDTLRSYKDHLEEMVQQRTTELMLARDAAEEANKAKSVFLANMSHELRTPLNAILGFSNMMRIDPLLSDKQRQNLDIINRSGEHLLTLINDVLEMSKIEAGRVHLENAPFDLGTMVRDVIDMMQIRAHEKGLRLLIDQDSRFPRYIVGDEARLRQILINLIGNAVKFTRQGGVTLRLGTKKNKISHLQIEVEDSGSGIAPEDQARVFEPFVQLDEQGGNKGTGLGLSITRQFVQMMGGNIHLDSTLGKGSLFRVDLPLNEVMENDIIKPKQVEEGKVVGLAPGQPEYRILIVEDQRDNQLLLSQLLKSVGFQVKVAENGKEGIQLFQSWHPHLIWMDRRMPVMDGMDATRRIRALPDGKEVKIIAVTASAFIEQRAEMLKVGMDDFVRKPYRSNEIYECLSKQLGVRYLYEWIPALEQPAMVLTPEMLSVLPEAMRRDLADALESLETQRIAWVIQQVAAYDRTLQKTLTHLAENFDYPTILKALQALTETL